MNTLLFLLLYVLPPVDAPKPEKPIRAFEFRVAGLDYLEYRP
jgi:hypothetical protein